MAIAYQDQATSQAGAKTTTIAATAPTAYRIGSRGDAVATYQKRLTELGYNTGTADGIYGNMTAAAVKRFQSDHGLVADGILGSKTIAAMISANTAKETQQYQAVEQAKIDEASATNEMNTVGTGATIVQPTSSQQLGANAQAQTKSGDFDVHGMFKPDVPELPSAPLTPKINNGTGYAPADDYIASAEATRNAEKLGLINTQRAAAGLPPLTPEQYAASLVPKPQGNPYDEIPYTQNGSIQPQAQQVSQTPSNPVLMGDFKQADYAQMASTTEEKKKEKVVKTAPTSPTDGLGIVKTKVPDQTVQVAQTGAQSGTEASPEQLASAAATTGIQSRYTQLFDQLNTMTPEWNPDNDPDYQRDAAKLENKVTQMMVARGGLYSSVARAALQSGLTDLELGYRKQAYERFTTERTFVFQQLQFVAQRIDAEFEKAMAVKNYELAVQKEEFDQRMAIAQFKADQAARAASLSIQRAQLKAAQDKVQAEKDLADAQKQQQATYNSLNQQGAMLRVNNQLLSSAIKKFSNGDYLNGEEQALLGLNSSSSYWDTVSAINAKRSALEYEKQTWRSRVTSLGDAQSTLDAYSDIFAAVSGPSSRTISTRTTDGDNEITTTEKWGS